MSDKKKRSSSKDRRLLWIARGIALAWAAFWGYFLLGHASGDGASMGYVAGGTAVLVVLLGLAFFAPRIAAAAFLTTAIGSFFFFEGWPARAFMTTPTAVLAVLFFLGSRRS